MKKSWRNLRNEGKKRIELEKMKFEWIRETVDWRRISFSSPAPSLFFQSGATTRAAPNSLDELKKIAETTIAVDGTGYTYLAYTCVLAVLLYSLANGTDYSDYLPKKNVDNFFSSLFFVRARAIRRI